MLWPAALGIGIVLGLFGAGGGMVTVPALIYLADMPVKEAVATSLWVVALVSTVSLITQRAWRVLQVKLLLTFGLTGMAGSILGTQVGSFIPDNLQLALFALLIFVVVWWTARVKLSDQVSVFRFVPAAITGLVIGILTGVLGVGGGFLLVPALIYMGIALFPTAVAHSLILISINAVAGGLAYTSTVTFSLRITLAVSAVAAIGSTLGSFMLKRLPTRGLQQAFSLLLLMLGGLVLWRATV